MPDRSWFVVQNSSDLGKQFTCGHCGTYTATAQQFGRYVSGAWQPEVEQHVELLVCTNCWAPTYFAKGRQTPAPPVGRMVKHLPPVVESAYREAMTCLAAGAPTAAALMCRKILMNVAVEKGAKPGLQFAEYVDYLVANHYVPPDSGAWLTHIRKGGNAATHEISPTDTADALELVEFTESLLTNVFELPGRMKQKTASAQASGAQTRTKK